MNQTETAAPKVLRGELALAAAIGKNGRTCVLCLCAESAPRPQ